MIGSAEFSPCGRYRYALRRTWDADRRPVLFVGLNPSTADAQRDDQTIRRCIAFAKSWRYGGIVVGDLFAFRATRPRDLRAAVEPIGPENDSWLLALAKVADLTIAAWGNQGRYRGRDAAVLNLLGTVQCLGTTKPDSPRHPLYLPADTSPRRLRRKGA